ncbi:MAG: AAA family ATPase [Thermoguttaceae bacterium]|jgi:ABC-type taurine transport system ATPase subunit
MLTGLRIRNFKRFGDVDIELGKSVVFIGPNNSGKTSALQALALWDIGLRQWNAKRGGKASPEKRPGVTINRRDLISIPVPAADLLWRNLRVRHGRRVEGNGGEQETRTGNIRIDVIVSGVTNDTFWTCGLEFDYSNEESFVCRPLRLPGFKDVPVKDAKFSPVPREASGVKVAYLPPMSGLADREFIKQPGEIGFLIGQGQTAQVLRNLCYQISSDPQKAHAWTDLVDTVRLLFGATLRKPDLITERGEITMDYEQEDARLDLSSSGRGLQQTLLLLSHLYANPNTVLLLDEPDAHLEIFRQRQTYQLLTEVAANQGSQVIAASHSEVVLAEAAGRGGKVVAFVGRPHTMNDRGGQVLKALATIGWDQYYQAEQSGWVLYLEGASDLAILKTFARVLGHRAFPALERPFVYYVSTNLPQRARDHFFGLREGKTDLPGVAIFDHLETPLRHDSPLVELMWDRREIENYFCTEDVLLAYARHDQQQDDLFGLAERGRREQAMRESIREVAGALLTLGKPDPWSREVKATDDFLDPVFRKFFSKLDLPLAFRKCDYHMLAGFVPKERIDPEIAQKLDQIAAVADRATPAQQ